MASKACKRELESLLKTQKDDMYEDGPKMLSEFYKEYTKYTWYATHREKLKSGGSGDITNYEVNSGYDYLLYTYLKFETPRIAVKDEYKGKVRICFTHNLGNNIINTANFTSDNESYQEMDHTWLDIHPQFYQKQGAGKRKAHNISMGNTHHLEEWNYEFLPPYKISVHQPWFYSYDTAVAYPILYQSSSVRANHHYAFNLALSHLLRVQFRGSADDEWINATPTNIMKYINCPVTSLSLPELWGKYASISAEERSACKCLNSRYYYIREVINCDDGNEAGYNSTVTVPLISENPCAAIFWVAENVDAKSINNHSNYTTCTLDIQSGWNPISKVSLLYGQHHKIKDDDAEYFSQLEPSYHFPSCPDEQGYHGMSYANDSTNFDSDIAIALPSDMSCKIRFFLADGNIYNARDLKPRRDALKNIDDINDSKSISVSQIDDDIKSDFSTSNAIVTTDSPKFNVKCRLLVLRKLTIDKPDGKNWSIKVE